MCSENTDDLEDLFRVNVETTVNIRYYWNGRWQFGKDFGYFDGKFETMNKFDPDLISFKEIWDEYVQRFGVKDLKYLLCLEPGKNMLEGLFAFVGDASVHRILSRLDVFARDIAFFPITKYDLIVFPDDLLVKIGISRERIVVEDVGGSVGLGGESVNEKVVHSEARRSEEGSAEEDHVEEDSESESKIEEEDSDGESDSESGVGEYVSEGLVRVEVRKKRVRYDPKEGRAYFSKGMTFKDADAVREALKSYSVVSGKDYKIVRSEPDRVRVICRRDNCPFIFYASKEKGRPGLKIKTLCMQHKCYRVFKNSRVTTKWIASQLREFIQENPGTRIKKMQTDIEKLFRVHVSFDKCKRARKLILNELQGSFKEDFGMLDAYAHELKSTNPGSTIAIELCRDVVEEGRRVFKRMYICFDACRKGWKDGCRPIIGLDGCFLKTKIKGMLLTAIGVDGMNHMYPIAFAVVSKENKNNWTWFLQRLVHELNLGDGSHITLMSDMQKGLIPAVLAVLPMAEHRWCARHIYANWSKKWRGEEMRKRFWICAWSTYEEEFQDNLKHIGDLSSKAARDLVSYAPQAWCRAYFSSRCKCAMVDNNISETFNSWILDARCKPIVKMIEEIRIKIMNLLVENEKKLSSWFNDYSPHCMELYEDWADIASRCRVEWNGETAYEVSEGDDRHSVWLDKKMCTCRAWDLTGIPCPHGIAALYHKGEDPIAQISAYYHKLTYAAAYSNKMQPVRGQKFWRVDSFKTIEPPPIPIMTGRPKKSRKKDKIDSRNYKSTNESQASTGICIERHSLKGKQQTCGKCGQLGHNKRSCKKESGQPSLVDEPPVAEPPASHEHSSHTHTDDLTQEAQVDPAGRRPPNAILRHRMHQSSQRLFHSQQERGHGIFYDENGNIIYNPGHADSYIVSSYGHGNHNSEDEEEVPLMPDHDTDPKKKFPIPSEKEVITNARKTSHVPTGSRIINLKGDGYEVSMPGRLPFKPPPKARLSLGDLEKQQRMKKLKKKTV